MAADRNTLRCRKAPAMTHVALQFRREAKRLIIQPDRYSSDWGSGTGRGSIMAESGLRFFR
jgi:hypothetical protein